MLVLDKFREKIFKVEIFWDLSSVKELSKKHKLFFFSLFNLEGLVGIVN